MAGRKWDGGLGKGRRTGARFIFAELSAGPTIAGPTQKQNGRNGRRVFLASYGHLQVRCLATRTSGRLAGVGMGIDRGLTLETRFPPSPNEAGRLRRNKKAIAEAMA